jgi:RimJ/RimL family protein N-acetyltransferase
MRLMEGRSLLRLTLARFRPVLKMPIRLEPLNSTHLDAVAALVADPTVRRFTRIPEPPPPGFAETWLQRYEAGRREGTREGFAVVEDGTFLGLALVVSIDREAQTVELGYIVAGPARGRGVATEALRLLTEWAVSTLGAVRVELLISVDNPASRRVAERCGYELEGVMRSVYTKPGLREDMEIWSWIAE